MHAASFAPVACFDDLRPGDQVRIKWIKSLTHGARECYPKEGVVVQVTQRFIAVRSPSGFVFSVGAHDLACGVEVKKGVR